MRVSDGRVLISGAGVAGLTAAYWLARFGFSTTVVERAPALRSGGYKIDVRGAALEVVDRMGVMTAVRDRRTDIRSGSIVTAGGRRVAAMDGDTFGGRTHGDVEIARGDLLALLHELCRARGVEVVFGESIDELSPEADGVTVSLTGGGSHQVDLVIGADGLHSATRRAVFGPSERFVRDLGYGVCVHSVGSDLGLDREEVTYVAPGRTALVYRTATDPDATAMYLFRTESFPAGALTDRTGQLDLLTEIYAGQGWLVPELLTAAVEAPDFYFDSLSQVVMQRWAADRVVLVGDAAYGASTASGQGTSLALVGGYVLAGELATRPEHVSAITRYETLMRPFVQQNQALAPANVKRMVLSSRSQVRLTLAALRLINRLPFGQAVMAKATEPIHRAATAVALPTYEPI